MGQVSSHLHVLEVCILNVVTVQLKRQTTFFLCFQARNIACYVEMRDSDTENAVPHKVGHNNFLLHCQCLQFSTSYIGARFVLLSNSQPLKTHRIGGGIIYMSCSLFILNREIVPNWKKSENISTLVFQYFWLSWLPYIFTTFIFQCIRSRPGYHLFTTSASTTVLHHSSTPDFYEEVKVRKWHYQLLLYLNKHLVRFKKKCLFISQLNIYIYVYSFHRVLA